MTVLGVVFVFALFSGLGLMAHFTRKRVVEEPLREARARGSAVAEFVDDLQKHRWTVIILVAVLVAVDRSLRLSSGRLQSKLVIAVLITALFAGRMLWRRRAGSVSTGDDRDR